MRSLTLILLLITFTSCLQQDPEAIDPIPETGNWQQINASDGFSGGNVKDIYFEGAEYWVATNKGVSHFDGSGFTQFTTDDVLLHNNVTSIEKANGEIWFGTLGGANIWDGTQWFEIPHLSGYEWQILTMELLQNGDLLIGTTGGGIIIYDGNSFLSFYDDNCNDCNFINTIFEDSKGNVWVGSAADLKQLDQDLNLIKSYSTELAGQEVLSIYEDFRGWIWVGFNDTNKINNLVDDKVSGLELIYNLALTPVNGFIDGPDNELWIATLVNNIHYYDGAVLRRLFEGPATDRKIFCMKSAENKILIGTDDGIYIYTLP